MESSQTSQEPKKSMGMAGQQLLTPEEPLLNSFSAPSEPKEPTQTGTPPVSPEFRALSIQDWHDPLFPPPRPHTQALYEELRSRSLFGPSTSQRTTPERQSSSQSEREPFVQAPSTFEASPTIGAAQANAPVDRSQSKGSAASPNAVSAPKAEHVGVAAHFTTHKMDYYKYIMSQNEELDRLQKEKRRLPSPVQRSAGRDSYDQRQVSRLSRSNRVEKPRTGSQAAANAKAAKVSPPKAVRPEASPSANKTETSKRHRRQTSTPASSSGGLSQSVQPKARTRAPPSKDLPDKGLEWYKVPDFCPPTDSLDQPNSKHLQTTWTNGKPLPLENDPDRHHLHPQEVEIASILRLNCSLYLKSKRKIFQAKVEMFKMGKDFNKTCAQGVTGIDVNKASKLWKAFDDAGWFNEKWFEQYV